MLAGSVEMLRFCVGSGKSRDVLYSGKMYSAKEAEKIGLVEWATPAESLESEALKTAHTLAGKAQTVFGAINSLLRGPSLR